MYDARQPILFHRAAQWVAVDNKRIDGDLHLRVETSETQLSRQNVMRRVDDDQRGEGNDRFKKLSGRRLAEVVPLLFVVHLPRLLLQTHSSCSLDYRRVIICFSFCFFCLVSPAGRCSLAASPGAGRESAADANSRVAS
jgi:hypothetical protein